MKNNISATVILLLCGAIAMSPAICAASRDEASATQGIFLPIAGIAGLMRVDRTFKGDGKEVVALAFSRDGKLLASGDDDRNIILWDAVSGVRLKALEKSGDKPVAISFSPDGRTLAVLEKKKDISLWDTTTGARSKTLKGHLDDVLALAFSPRKNVLATGGEDKTVIIWDTATGAAINTLKGHTNDVLAVAFTPDGKGIVSADKDKKVIQWNVATGAQLRPPSEADKAVTSLVFSPDGKILAGATDDKAVQLWDTVSGAKLRRLECGDTPLAIHFNPQGSLLTGITKDKELILWNVSDGRELVRVRKFADDLKAVAFTRDGTIMVVPGKDDAIVFMEIPAIIRQFAAEGSRAGTGKTLFPYAFNVELDKYDADHNGFETEILGEKALIPLTAEQADELGRKETNKKGGKLGRLLPDFLKKKGKITVRIEGMLRLSTPDKVELVNAALVDEASRRRFPFGVEVRGTTVAVTGHETRPTGRKAPPGLEITSILLAEPSGNGMLDAGETGKVRVSLKNSGKGKAGGVAINLEPAEQSAPATGLLLKSPIDVGELGPGEKATSDIEISAGEDIRDAAVKLKATATEESGFDSRPVLLSFRLKELTPPLLQVAKVEIEDPDGKRIVSKGKEASITLTVRNSGAGQARGVIAGLDSNSEEVKLFSEGEIVIGNIAPGETKKAVFTIAVTQRYQGDKTLPLSFTVREERERFTIRPAVRISLNEEAPNMRVVKMEARETIALAPTSEEDINSIPPLDKSQRVAGPQDAAVVIGIERYQNVPRSDYAYNDARTVKSYLTALGFAERNIEFLADDRATLSSIRKSIETWLPNRVRKGSRVFIYFSGHGAPEPATGEAYIVPFDGDPNYLPDTGYPLKRLYASLGKLPATEVVVVLDSCFSGSGGRSVLAKGARPLVMMADTQATPANLVVLSSTQGSQISTSFEEKEHGVFTYYFLKAIKEGRKTVADIYEYVRPQVEDEAKRRNVSQSPSITPDAEKLKGRFQLRK